MSMELISMEHWHTFFPNEADLKRAKKSQLDGVLSVLPWIAIVDKFQHWLYENPTHSIEQREKTWISILDEFASGEGADWSGLEMYKKCSWQKQLHIFEVPFYYIEYGFAQLGAIAMWKQYKENPVKALENYEAFMKLGYTKSIPEIYKMAGNILNSPLSCFTGLCVSVRQRALSSAKSRPVSMTRPFSSMTLISGNKYCSTRSRSKSFSVI